MEDCIIDLVVNNSDVHELIDDRISEKTAEAVSDAVDNIQEDMEKQVERAVEHAISEYDSYKDEIEELKEMIGDLADRLERAESYIKDMRVFAQKTSGILRSIPFIKRWY